MTTLRPVLYLDVDGVLNAIPYLSDDDVIGNDPIITAQVQERAAEVGKTAYDDYRADWVNGYKITWSPTVIAAVKRWATIADMRWLTTWRDDAPGLLGPLFELPEFPAAYPPNVSTGVLGLDRENRFRWWKLDVVKLQWNVNPGPFVWIDDDLSFEAGAEAWAQSIDTDSRLAINPEPYVGLSKEDVREVDAFLGRF